MTIITAAPVAAASTAGRGLSDRERAVLRGVGRGRTDAEIAAALHVPEPTVRRHVGRILDKLALRDRAAAIVYAFDHGIVRPGHAEPPAPAPVSVSSAGWRFGVLGPLRAWRGDRPVELGPVRQQTLLAALLLRPNVAVGQQQLLRDVWDAEPPAGNVAPVYVYRLRRCLQAQPGAEPVIASDPAGYRFLSAGVWLDVTCWADRLTEAKAAEQADDPAAAIDAYTRALALFRGEPLAGLPGPFAAGERLRLSERRTAVALAKLALQLRLGQHADAIGELSALIHQHPYHEAAAALLMRALHASGRQADALAVYLRTRQRLVDDLGVEPDLELRRAHQFILRGAAARSLPTQGRIA